MPLFLVLFLYFVYLSLDQPTMLRQTVPLSEEMQTLSYRFAIRRRMSECWNSTSALTGRLTDCSCMGRLHFIPDSQIKEMCKSLKVAKKVATSFQDNCLCDKLPHKNYMSMIKTKRVYYSFS